MIFSVFLITLGIAWLVPLSSTAFTPTSQEYLIRHYTVADGLPVNSVNGLVQDDFGYLYMTTHDGLVRFDGYHFTTFTTGDIPGMRTNRIGGLLHASDNAIWLFNEDGTIVRKKDASFTTFSAPEIPGHANWLTQASDGRIWVSGSNGLAYFDSLTASFNQLTDPLFQSDISVVGSGTNSDIFAISRSNGLIWWENDQTHKLLTISEHPRLASDVRSIRQFDDTHLWIVGSSMLMRYDLSSGDLLQASQTNLEETAFWNIDIDHLGRHILTANNGFYELMILDSSIMLQKLPIDVNSRIIRNHIVFTGQDNESILIGDDEVLINGQTVLRAPSIKFGFMDKEGSLWVGSETQGLYQIRRSSIINLTRDQIPGLHNVYSIIEDQNGHIWTCSLTDGITRISGNVYQNWDSTHPILQSGDCRFLFEDADGIIFAGLTTGNILVYDQNDWSELNLASDNLEHELYVPRTLFRTRDQLLFGNGNALMSLQNGRLRLFNEQYSLQLQSIQVFREDSRGILYTGSSGNGLVRIAGEQITPYTAADGVINSNNIRDIFLQSDDTLWVANENLGLNRLILNDAGEVLSSSSITSKNGLMHNSLHRIIVDTLGYMWMSSNGGIMRVSLEEINRYADGLSSRIPILHFDEKDGMLNREANGGVHSSGIMTSSNQLWFPNQSGVTVIDPYELQAHHHQSILHPVIESVETRDDVLPISGQAPLVLPSGHRDVRFNFTAPNFAYQDRVQFSYWLDAIGSYWQSAQQNRQAVFTSLPAGTHTLRIRAESTAGEPVETMMQFTIKPFFYEQWWFITLMGILGIGLLTGTYKLRIRSLQDRERQLQLRVDEQTKALQEAAEQKSRFFTGITHDLKTPLSLISAPLEDILHQDCNVSPVVLRDRVSLMHRNSQRLTHLINQLLDVTKLNNDAIRLAFQPVDLNVRTRQVVGQFHSLMMQKSVSLRMETAVSEPVYIDVEAWERVVINLMSNAIKFSPSHSEITLLMQEDAGTVTVTIRDEGPGIPPHEQENIFEYLYQAEGGNAAEGTGIGLYLVRGLVLAMGGEIRVVSEPGRGASFIVILKKGYNHIDAIHTVAHHPLTDDLPTPIQAQNTSSKQSNSEKGVESSEPSEITQTQSDTPGHSDSTTAQSATIPAQTDTILIVEDNDDFREYLTSILSDTYHVLAAPNGSEALIILQKQTPSLVISDIMMPGMNGLEFVNTLRKQDQFNHLPVIFLSARDQESDKETGLSTGADIYLTKPIRSRMLLTQIEAVLRRERVLKNETPISAQKSEPMLVQQVREVIYRQLANPNLSAAMLADALYVSRAKLYADWKDATDITLNNFIMELRLEEAKTLLKEKGFNVQEAAHAVGFTEPNYFSTRFKKQFGTPPSQFVKK